MMRRRESPALDAANQARPRECPRGPGRTIIALENIAMKTKTNIRAGQAIDEALDLLGDLGNPPVNP